jgi:hypothetical protein
MVIACFTKFGVQIPAASPQFLVGTIETCTIQGMKPVETLDSIAQIPLSIALSNRVLEKIDQEASKQK